MIKVKEYKRQIEKFKTDHAHLIIKQRDEMENIRTFYNNVAFGLGRTSVLMRTSLLKKYSLFLLAIAINNYVCHSYICVS